MRSLAIALVHYPILARDGSVVTTAITNLDMHDIARSAYTFGVERYYIVHPIFAQRQLAQRVVTHWTTGSGKERIPDRQAPMECVEIVEDLAGALGHFGAEHEGEPAPEVWVTSAQDDASTVSHAAAREMLTGKGGPILLVFGTGWGLAPEVMQSATTRLAPISSPRPDGYNHLSVRAAAAILLDRLLVGGAL